VSYDPRTQGLEAIICATTGTCVATAAISLLIYNNWSYVRDRLLSATVEYEETGWYDGQVRVYFHYRVYFNARMGNVIDVVFYLP
jgi:hypothetical protein